MAIQIIYQNDALYHPLYAIHSGQLKPEAAYVYLDCEDRVLWADVGLSGGSRTMKEFHGHVFSYSADHNLSWDQINDLLDEIAPIAEKICDAHTSEWDGNNMVARYPGASSICRSYVQINADIEAIVRSFDKSDAEGTWGEGGLWNATDWLSGITTPTEDEDGNDVVEIEGYGTIRKCTTDEQISAMAKRIEAEANMDLVSVPDADEYLTNLRDDSTGN